MLPFDQYPKGGRQLLGGRREGNSRRGYGLDLQRMLPPEWRSVCAYCDTSLVDSFEHWLTMQVDHVVPQAWGRTMGIPEDWLQDYSNAALCCSACNSYGNRWKPDWEASAPQTLEDFYHLRDRCFEARRPKIRQKRKEDEDFYRGRPWED